MIKLISALTCILFSFGSLLAQDKILSSGMKLKKSTRIKQATYKLDAPTDISKAVIIIEGNDIVIDFNNAMLRGSNRAVNADEFKGVGILIQNSRNVTIKNLNARGYKIALIARNVDKLTLEDCDLSYNYRQHLNSSQEKEDISDWMSYHQNEQDEWLRYGAAFYLNNCDSALVRRCKVTGGQNSLMMVQSNGALIYNNDFSFNSGIGIGMYRCSGNRVMYNKIDFNVRGYSHGVYNRGQDSAGILVYEQSNNNVFYKNSVTHGGDGFFLWAGQSTLNTGEGGCNDNLLMKNDFSYAPTNGIEVTFSRNTITGNRIFECDNGIWGGYSFNTRINNNHFRNNRVGIAIEHGLHNMIDYNLFLNDKEAIKLWSSQQQPSDWGYPKHRDTRSAGYVIAMNSFNANATAMKISRTDSVDIYGNTYSAVDKAQDFSTDVSNLDSTNTEIADSTPVIEELRDAIDAFKGTGLLAGRKNILVNEWGPYDFKSPIIWLTNPTEKSDTLRFDLLGPKGAWKVKSVKGAKVLSKQSGTLSGSVAEKLLAIKSGQGANATTDIKLELEYIGAAIVTQQGEKRGAGKPYVFSFRKFFQPIQWEVRFFSMDTAFHNPVRTGELFAPNVRMAPVKTENVDRLDYAWWGGLKAEEQYKQFMTVAEGTARIGAGEYELSVTWDDAVRVYVDNKLVLNEWNPSRYKFDESPNRKIRLKLGGNHSFRVEHLELGSFATLSVKLRPLAR